MAISGFLLTRCVVCSFLWQLNMYINFYDFPVLNKSDDGNWREYLSTLLNFCEESIQERV